MTFGVWVFLSLPMLLGRLFRFSMFIFAPCRPLDAHLLLPSEFCCLLGGRTHFSWHR